MAFEHLPTLWKHSRQTGTALLVLAAVASHCDANGVWIADQATLQSCVRLSRRRVKQILDELVASGELAVIPGDGRGHRSTYRLTVGSERVKPAAPFVRAAGVDDIRRAQALRIIAGKRGTS